MSWKQILRHSPPPRKAVPNIRKLPMHYVLFLPHFPCTLRWWPCPAMEHSKPSNGEGFLCFFLFFFPLLAKQATLRTEGRSHLTPVKVVPFWEPWEMEHCHGNPGKDWESRLSCSEPSISLVPHWFMGQSAGRDGEMNWHFMEPCSPDWLHETCLNYATVMGWMPILQWVQNEKMTLPDLKFSFFGLVVVGEFDHTQEQDVVDSNNVASELDMVTLNKLHGILLVKLNATRLMRCQIFVIFHIIPAGWPTLARHSFNGINFHIEYQTILVLNNISLDWWSTLGRFFFTCLWWVIDLCPVSARRGQKTTESWQNSRWQSGQSFSGQNKSNRSDFSMLKGVLKNIVERTFAVDPCLPPIQRDRNKKKPSRVTMANSFCSFLVSSTVVFRTSEFKPTQYLWI